MVKGGVRMMRDKYLNYIAGEWVDGPDVAQNINPSDISEVIADYVRADRPQTIEAINAASNAAESWRNFGVQARSDLLDSIGNKLLNQKESIGI